MALLDTHKAVEELVASGLKKKQAEVITGVFSRLDDQLATKSDIQSVKSEITNLKSDVSKLQTDVVGLKTDVAGLKEEVSGIKTDISWGRNLLFVILALVIGLWFK